MKTLIIGAGIGGLAASIAFRLNGHQATVCEKTDVFAPVGAGIQLSPNAMHVLDDLGVANQICAHAFEPEFAAIRDYKDGRYQLRTPLRDVCTARYGQPYLHIHRADLHAVLLERAVELGVDVQMGVEVSTISQTGNSVSAETAVGKKLEADLLVGADGLHSGTEQGVQAQLFGPSEPNFTKQVAWRAMLPTEHLPAGLVPPDATIWSGPGKHLVTYYVSAGKMVNIVAVEERDDLQQESWVSKGDPSELRRAFAGWHEDVQTLLAAVHEASVWALYDRAPLASWSKGRATLLGDACHPMLPFLAQGGAMAIEDAYVLAKKVSEPPDDLAFALGAYEAARKPRTSRIQHMAQVSTGIFHQHQTFAYFAARAKFSLGRLAPKLAYLELDRLYGFDVTKG